jgi:hypothetical protein
MPPKRCIREEGAVVNFGGRFTATQLNSGGAEYLSRLTVWRHWTCACASFSGAQSCRPFWASHFHRDLSPGLIALRPSDWQPQSDRQTIWRCGSALASRRSRTLTTAALNARYPTFGAAIDIWPPRRVGFQPSAGQDKPAKIRFCSEDVRYEG